MTCIDLSYTAELTKPVPERALTSPLFYGDNMAHRLCVTLTKGGVEVCPEGVGAAVYFMRPDGRTVYVEGTVNGSLAEVVLSDECYRFTGAFTLILRLTGEVQNMTVLSLRGTVARATSETVITSTKEIYNLNDLLRQLTDLNDLALLLNTSAERLKEQIFSVSENLFDNSNFCLPVNQAGELVHRAGNIVYLCDRWQLPGDGYTALHSASSGIMIGGGGSERRVTLRQTFEEGVLDLRMGYTAAVYLSDGSAPVQTVTPQRCTASDGSGYVAVEISVPLDEPIRGVSLFAGLYTEETLPTFQWRGAAAELAACRRWFVRWSRSNMPLLTGYMESSRTQMMFAAPEMRAEARLAGVGGSCTAFCASSTAVIAAGSAIVTSARTASVVNGMFVLTGSSAFSGTNHYPVTLVLGNDAMVDFTAEFE